MRNQAPDPTGAPVEQEHTPDDGEYRRRRNTGLKMYKALGAAWDVLPPAARGELARFAEELASARQPRDRLLRERTIRARMRAGALSLSNLTDEELDLLAHLIDKALPHPRGDDARQAPRQALRQAREQVHGR